MNAPEFHSFGCRLNAAETRIMQSQARESDSGNTIVFNTCAVTSEAVRQARQAIRKAHRANPERRIVVTGCAAQTNPDEFARMKEVDLVLGNEEKFNPALYAPDAPDTPAHGGNETTVRVGDIMAEKRMNTPALHGFGERARAFVQVQNGCNHRCTFCIIPFGRGNARSAPPSNILSQIQDLVDRGYREVVLTGVDITAYGPDLDPDLTLGILVSQILRQIPDLERLRLSSLDPVETDSQLLQLFGEDHRLLPHLHLSLQSGDNLILKRMKRRHTREDAIAFCQSLRKIRPDMAFGADLIAGFPTETQEMFENTARLIEDCSLSFLHVFPFSARPQTPAANMPQLAGNVVRERAGKLRKIGDQAKARYFSAQIGKIRQVLIEQENKGHTEHFVPVKLHHPTSSGSLLKVRITGAEETTCQGEVVT